MSGSFDPYHKWLGIPSTEQPANYYRLLGLELFEDDPDTIECAADRLLKYVRGVATDARPEDAQRVLDELSAAKRCLLIVQQKRVYDAGLRAGRATTTQSRRSRLARESETCPAIDITSEPRTKSLARTRRPPARRSRRVVVAFAAAGLIGLTAVSSMLRRSVSQPSNDVAGRSHPRASAVSVPPHDLTSTPAVRPVRAVGSKLVEPRGEAAPSRPDSSVAESSLPEFVSRVSNSDVSDNVETASPEPIGEKPNDSVKELVAPEPQIADIAEPLDSRQAIPSVKMSETGEPQGLLRELWTDVKGNNVEEFVQYVVEHPKPNHVETVDRFETPEDFGDQYGQRLRGLLYPPVSGIYRFSIRANAAGWLYVSSDATPSKKQRVEPGTEIELQAGKAYYVEAYHKESTGRDYLSIGWKLPDETQEHPIPGARLSVKGQLTPTHETEFVVLTPLAAESTSAAVFDMLDDGKILTTGPMNPNEIYRLTFESRLEAITAFRIEALPHDTLPASGPGRGNGGRFAIAEVTAMVSAALGESTPLNFASVLDDAGHDLRRIADGNEKTFWRSSGRGEQAGIILVVRDPTPLAAGKVIQLELKQRESVGHFRLLATSATDPMSVVRPAQGRSSDETVYSLHVNLGGKDFTTPDGVRWSASKLFDNKTFGHEGGRGVSEDLIGNQVQGSAQRGIAAFRAVVPQGTYDVTLYFCEYWSTSPDSRRFAIAAEQRVVVPGMDLLRAAGGYAKPLVLPLRGVLVEDGRLDVEFRATSEGASTILNAIRIQQVR